MAFGGVGTARRWVVGEEVRAAAGELVEGRAPARVRRWEGASELHWARAEQTSGSREAGEC